MRRLGYQVMTSVLITFFVVGVVGMGCRRTPRSGQTETQTNGPQTERKSIPGRNPNAQQTLTPVQVIRVSRQSLDVRITMTSTLFADKDVVVYPEISGRVEQIFHDVGDWVNKGELLIQLDDKDLQVSYNKAMVAKERLEKDLKRQESLLKSQLISQDTYDLTGAQYKQAVLDFEVAQLNLERTRISAPISGQIVERTVTQGQFINPSTPLMRIVNTREIFGQLYLPEKELTRVRTGQKVYIETDLHPGETFDGVVDQVSPVVDEQSGTFRVRYRVLKGIGKLLPGMFVRSHVVVDRKDNVIVVPKAALVREEDRNYVYVVENNQAYRRRVEIGFDGGDVVEVLSGISSDAEVIVAGYIGLQDGQKVRVVI